MNYKEAKAMLDADQTIRHIVYAYDIHKTTIDICRVFRDDISFNKYVRQMLANGAEHIEAVHKQ